MIQLYAGDGKGKTTAAFGQALRAIGHGWSVCVVQFLKDGSSGEVAAIKNLPNVSVVACASGITFSFRMSEEQRAAARDEFARMLSQATELVHAGKARLLVLDEACAAVSSGLLEESAIMAILDEAQRQDERGTGCEVVITGRDPSEALLERADYVTEMRCVRHPYERGLSAREGIEY
jgi:cob(I)alamin adenosyltransferase